MNRLSMNNNQNGGGGFAHVEWIYCSGNCGQSERQDGRISIEEEEEYGVAKKHTVSSQSSCQVDEVKLNEGLDLIGMLSCVVLDEGARKAYDSRKRTKKPNSGVTSKPKNSRAPRNSSSSFHDVSTSTIQSIDSGCVDNFMSKSNQSRWMPPPQPKPKAKPKRPIIAKKVAGKSKQKANRKNNRSNLLIEDDHTFDYEDVDDITYNPNEEKQNKHNPNVLILNPDFYFNQPPKFNQVHPPTNTNAPPVQERRLSDWASNNFPDLTEEEAFQLAIQLSQTKDKIKEDEDEDLLKAIEESKLNSDFWWETNPATTTSAITTTRTTTSASTSTTHISYEEEVNRALEISLSTYQQERNRNRTKLQSWNSCLDEDRALAEAISRSLRRK